MYINWHYELGFEGGLASGSRLSESEEATPALHASPGDNGKPLQQPLERTM